MIFLIVTPVSCFNQGKCVVEMCSRIAFDISICSSKIDGPEQLLDEPSSSVSFSHCYYDFPIC